LSQLEYLRARDSIRAKNILEELERSSLKPKRIHHIFKIINAFSDLPTVRFYIPTWIFNNKLSPLESITKFLKEDRNLTIKQISILLNKHYKTIWITYQQAKKKQPSQLVSRKLSIYIPISVFRNKSQTVFKTLVSVLKEEYKLRYSEIANLLSRDQRTIWTVYNRK